MDVKPLGVLPGRIFAAVKLRALDTLTAAALLVARYGRRICGAATCKQADIAVDALVRDKSGVSPEQIRALKVQAVAISALAGCRIGKAVRVQAEQEIFALPTAEIEQITHRLLRRNLSAAAARPIAPKLHRLAKNRE